jgi:hypothetical protein
MSNHGLFVGVSELALTLAEKMARCSLIQEYKVRSRPPELHTLASTGLNKQLIALLTNSIAKSTALPPVLLGCFCVLISRGIYMAGGLGQRRVECRVVHVHYPLGALGGVICAHLASKGLT